MAYLQNSQVTQLLAVGADAMDNMYDVTIVPPAGLIAWAQAHGGSDGALVGVTDQDLFNLTIRAKGFTPPEAKVKPYTVTYKTVSIERPSTTMDFSRSFSLEFRLDAHWKAYRFLSAWKNLLVSPATGFATQALWGEGGDGTEQGTINNVLGSVFVSALARPVHMTDGNPFRAYGVSDGTFTPTSSNPTGGEAATEPTDDETVGWRFDQVWPVSVGEIGFKQDGGGNAISIKADFKFGDFTDPIYSRHVSGSLF